MEGDEIPVMKKILWVIVALVCASIAGFASYWHFSSPDRTCNSCHEINTAHELWAQSAHREALCSECHGTALSNGFHSLWENSRRVIAHFSEKHPEDIRLTEAQVVEMVQRCKKCHEREYAGWLSSGHSMRYSDVFLNAIHNREEQINYDCLRCHAMFFEGSIQDMVTPISTSGPWTMMKAEDANKPAIPCLACHEIHFKGSPANRPDYSNPKMIASKREPRSPKPAFYDRREKRHFEITLLSQPPIRDGQRVIRTSPDSRQRLCYQCHAPNFERDVGSADDRTPKGVHEGLSCIACHSPHSLDTRPSCAECHPRLSNCNRDVDKMDTTFQSPASKYNIHFVACADCHPKGVPPKKPRTT